MSKKIKEIFDELCSHVKPDKALLKRVSSMEAGFVNKKQEHIEFFGGALTGVQVVRFTDDDRNKLFIDILEIDDHELEDRVHALPDINTEWLVSSDIFNISSMWLIHRFYHSMYLTDQEKQEGMLLVCIYMQYRFLTSLLFRSFKYPADPEIAAATYAQLSYKYVLKKEGSWGAALRFRAGEVVAKHSIWHKEIDKFDDNYRIVQMINDIQGRVRDMFKNIVRLHYEIIDKGSRLGSSSSMIEVDGALELKDKTKNISSYTRYLRTIITDEKSFIREELIEIVYNSMQTMPPKLLYNTLAWCSKNYRFMEDKIIENAIDSIMEHAFVFINENRTVLKNKNDLPAIISKLRGIYMSSRSTDALLMKVRKLCENIVKMSNKTKNDSVISSVKTGFMLYIVLRAFTMQHYINQ